MTSLSLFPRPPAFSAYSAVSGSRMTLCLAISCSALFACRSPPLLSLCLTVLPLEAGMGQAPHIAANDASERSLPGCPRPLPRAWPRSRARTRTSPAARGSSPPGDASIARSMSSAASRAAAHRSASAPSAAPSAPSARTEGSSSISLGPAIPRNLDLSPSGAVVSSDLAVLIAEVRAFTAPERAASMQRTPSTHPSCSLGSRALSRTSPRGRPSPRPPRRTSPAPGASSASSPGERLAHGHPKRREVPGEARPVGRRPLHRDAGRLPGRGDRTGERLVARRVGGNRRDRTLRPLQSRTHSQCESAWVSTRRRPARGRRVSIRFACLAPFFPCSPDRADGTLTGRDRDAVVRVRGIAPCSY